MNTRHFLQDMNPWHSLAGRFLLRKLTSISPDCVDGVYLSVSLNILCLRIASLINMYSTLPCHLGSCRTCRTVSDLVFALLALTYIIQRNIWHGIPGIYTASSISLTQIRPDCLRIGPPGRLVPLHWRIRCSGMDSRSCRIWSSCFGRIGCCMVARCQRWWTHWSRTRHMALWLSEAGCCHHGVSPFSLRTFACKLTCSSRQYLFLGWRRFRSQIEDYWTWREGGLSPAIFAEFVFGYARGCCASGRRSRRGHWLWGLFASVSVHIKLMSYRLWMNHIEATLISSRSTHSIITLICIYRTSVSGSH